MVARVYEKSLTRHMEEVSIEPIEFIGIIRHGILVAQEFRVPRTLHVVHPAGEPTIQNQIHRQLLLL